MKNKVKHFPLIPLPKQGGSSPQELSSTVCHYMEQIIRGLVNRGLEPDHLFAQDISVVSSLLEAAIYRAYDRNHECQPILDELLSHIFEEEEEDIDIN